MSRLKTALVILLCIFTFCIPALGLAQAVPDLPPADVGPESSAPEPGQIQEELPELQITDMTQQLEAGITGASFDPEVLYQSSAAEFTLTVGYTALTPDKAYYVNVTLIDPATGNPWLPDGQQPVQETAGLVPEGSDGTLDIPFTIDVSGLNGSVILTPRIEVLQEGGLTVCTSGEGLARLSVISPTLTQTFLASDGSGRIKNTGSSALVQTITFHGLDPEQQYTVKGELCAGRIQIPIELENGSRYTTSETFTPQAEDGRVVLTYKVQGEEITGITIVPRWELYKGKTLVASLTDGTLEPKIAVDAPQPTGDPENSPSPEPSETTPASSPEPEVSDETEPPAEDPEESTTPASAPAKSSSSGMLVIIIVMAAGIGAVLYFFVIRKRRR